MSFRNTIDPTVGKGRKNAGKSYQESVPTTNTDNSISPVRMFRKNAGKVYETPSQQIIEIVKPQLMRVGGKQRGIGVAIASYDDFITLYLKGDGTNGGTTFTDSSTTYPSKTITRSGNVKTSTAQKKYGTASIYFDGSGDFLTVTDSSDWDLESFDFTIEFWGYGLGTGIIACQAFDLGASNPSWALHHGLFGGNYYLQLLASSGSGSWNICSSFFYTTGITINAWNHYAFSRKNGTLKGFLNGTEKVSAAVGAFPFCSYNLVLGETTQIGFGSALTGYIDSFRFIKKKGLYATVFDPETDTGLAY